MYSCDPKYLYKGSVDTLYTYLFT